MDVLSLLGILLEGQERAREKIREKIREGAKRGPGYTR